MVQVRLICICLIFNLKYLSSSSVTKLARHLCEVLVMSSCDFAVWIHVVTSDLMTRGKTELGDRNRTQKGVKNNIS